MKGEKKNKIMNKKGNNKKEGKTVEEMKEIGLKNQWKTGVLKEVKKEWN